MLVFRVYTLCGICKHCFLCYIAYTTFNICWVGQSDRMIKRLLLEISQRKQMGIYLLVTCSAAEVQPLFIRHFRIYQIHLPNHLRRDERKKLLLE